MKELLVPVGNRECLTAAVLNGADAVYLGGKRFGARAFASNFDEEEMVEAIKFCHLYGVKIYVTVNTLIFESEMDSALEYLRFLHESGVDAVIVQDIGLIAAARKYLPNLEIHASTQVHNTNEAGIKFLEKLGVKRVVFARELSLDEIKNINTIMEKEAFIHGALCISYSGECLFSSMIMDRSGNRGECAQMCRLPFKLLRNNTEINTDGNYLLSTKELNTSTNFKGILDSDILSLKIEGRMKSAEYVGCVTSLYRDLIDKYNSGKELLPDPVIYNDLKVIFNREYTEGFINNASNSDLMNIKTSNHVGVPLGKVIDVDKKYIYVRLDKELNQGDGIRFNRINEGMIANFIMNRKTNLINKGEVGSVVLFDNKFNGVKVGDLVNKTLDVLLIDKYKTSEYKKVLVDIDFKVLDDNSLYIKVSDSENIVEKVLGYAQEAKNAPMTVERVSEQLSKLGGTPFKVNNINIDLPDNLFIVIKDLNELRRSAIDELIQLRENVKKDVVINKISNDANTLSDVSDTYKISVLVRNEEQAHTAIDMGVDRIYIEDSKLYNIFRSYDNVYFRTYRVGDKTSNLSKVLSTELGALYRLGGIGDYYLNVGNHYTIDYMSKYADMLTLSVELKDDELGKLMNHYNNNINVEKIVYSTIELMITKYCPLNLLVNKGERCSVCLDHNRYYLLDRNDKKYRLLQDTNIHLTHIMNYKPTILLDNIDYYKSIGIKNYRLEFLDESSERVKELISELKMKLGD